MSSVQLFITCLTDSFFPQTGEAVVEILNRLGMGAWIAYQRNLPGYLADQNSAIGRAASVNWGKFIKQGGLFYWDWQFCM